MRKKTLTRQVGVLFTEEAYNKLTRLTDAKEVPISKYIRMIVTGYLDHLEIKGGARNDASK